LAVGSGFCWFLYSDYAARKDLESAIAELDAVDPRWRLEDIEADRQLVRDEDNAAFVVLQAAGLMPRYWPPMPASFVDALAD
jgi:hypothetical protein